MSNACACPFLYVIIFLIWQLLYFICKELYGRPDSMAMPTFFGKEIFQTWVQILGLQRTFKCATSHIKICASHNTPVPMEFGAIKHVAFVFRNNIVLRFSHTYLYCRDYLSSPTPFRYSSLLQVSCSTAIRCEHPLPPKATHHGGDTLCLLATHHGGDCSLTLKSLSSLTNTIKNPSRVTNLKC